MNIVFRVDASVAIGSGHVFRCLTLARALREKGAKASFICRAHEGHLSELIMQNHFETTLLPPVVTMDECDHGVEHALWLGSPWRQDAEETRVAIEAMGTIPDWLVVDHYAIDRKWEGSLRDMVGQLMVIDDLADRMHDCDVLLDQNLVARMLTRYDDKAPAACIKLLGPDYALLHPVYSLLHDRSLPRAGRIRRIFIFFGGFDPHNLTGRALAAFLLTKRSDINVDVVIAKDSPHEDSIRKQIESHGNIRVFTALPTLAELLAKADLAIGAGGATNWERLCVGLPAIVITVAANQRPIARELSERGLVRWIGDAGDSDAKGLAKLLADLFVDGLDEGWSFRCRKAVDGRGAIRVCAVMMVNASTPLSGRRAKAEDEALLLSWANDKVTRQNAFSPAPISEESHQEWFRARLRKTEGCRIYIVETPAGEPIGQVRFERQERAWEVHYSLSPSFRGRGLGRQLLDAGLTGLRAEQMQGDLIFGRVKSDNHRSRKVFEALGFESQSGAGEIAVYRRNL